MKNIQKQCQKVKGNCKAEIIWRTLTAMIRLIFMRRLRRLVMHSSINRLYRLCRSEQSCCRN